MAANRIVLDAGALSALAHEEESIRVAIRSAMSAGVEIVVPAPVLAESTTGDSGRDASVNRVLKATTIAPLDERLARSAARLRHATRRRSPGTIDAMVVACADEQPGTILYTGDPQDLRLLASERARTRIVAIN